MWNIIPGGRGRSVVFREEESGEREIANCIAMERGVLERMKSLEA
jgi:hypothetical protein